MSIYGAVAGLVRYGQETGLICSEDVVYVRNQMLDVLHLTDYIEEEPEISDLEELLRVLLDYGAEQGLLVSDSVAGRDLWDTRLMNCLVPRPAEVIRRFWELYQQSPEQATDYYYKLSGDSNYIRRYRVAKDLKWVTETEYGSLDITINLSKPEKDPKDIAAALTGVQSAYPKCQLCRENEGYAGSLHQAARENHRLIPITIDSSKWFLQYSPYVYYKEHCIILSGSHTPMKIDRTAFRKLLDFITQFPHYFVGANADLPIVGGSILSHDHFQGGRYIFAMERAQVETAVHFTEYPDIQAGIVKWPMSVIRLSGPDPERITSLADRILGAWRNYTDEDAFVLAHTDGVPHNSITPIARRQGDAFELDLVLRNNIVTEAYPDGVYHPHPEHHHLKKENIGLIEVLGLAILPSRLRTEMELVKQALLTGTDIRDDEKTAKHADWTGQIREKYAIINEMTVDRILQDEMGRKYVQILEQSGVFKRTPPGRQQFLKFIEYVNHLPEKGAKE